MSRNFELLHRIGDSAQIVCLAAPERKVEVAVEEGLKANAALGQQQPEICKLVQQLFDSRWGIGPQLVAFAPVEADLGSEALCARAASALGAMSNGSVVLVYLDVASGPAAGAFRAQGAGEAIERDLPLEKFATQSKTDNIHVIPAGSSKDVSKLFTSSRLGAQLAALRKRFDHVLVQAPPLSRGPGALVVSSTCDAVVLVVESNSTRREIVLKAKHDLLRCGANVVGAVLNRRTFPIPQKIYERL
jgi:Mrp family chromosome partitioning ATPase